MPAHQATASQTLLPTGWPAKRSRIESAIDVTGWCSANHRTGPGIVSVGTKAELTNGRKMSGYEKALTPATDVAERPGITAIHVNASVSRIRMPATPSQAGTPAAERKPIAKATPATIAREIRFEMSEVST